MGRPGAPQCGLPHGSALPVPGPGKNERHPALEPDAAHQHQPTGAIARQRRARLREQEPRQHDVAVAADQSRHRRGQALQRLKQDIGEDQVERRSLAKPVRAKAGAMDDLDVTARSVVSRIRACNGDGASVDVARQHRPVQRPSCRDGEYAGAGTDIEDFPKPSRLDDPVERQQAAAGGAVMAGAESERRLDLDGDLVRAHVGACVCAVHHEPPGLDWCETLEAFAHPIGRRQRFERQAIDR
jgi:hypothetical protein